MTRAGDSEDGVMERRHCTDHTGMDAKIMGIDAKLEAKATLLMWILGGVGGAVLMILVYNQGRIDAQEKITAMLQANMLNVESRLVRVEEDLHARIR